MIDAEEITNSTITKRKLINGLVSNNVCPSELSLAIQKVMIGEYYVDRCLKRSPYRKTVVEEKQQNQIMLTKRENEILYCLSKGLSSKEIAEKLFLSPRTIDSHRSKIIQKYNLPGFTALLHFAHEHCKNNGNGKPN